MRKNLLIAALFSVQLAAFAQTVLFHTGDSTKVPYRIPAIAAARNGDLLAFTDHRWAGGDIGTGHLDILSRRSTDLGKSWEPAQMVLQGTNIKGPTMGYGDPCIAADTKKNELLLLACSGDVLYQRSTLAHHQGIELRRAKYDKKKQDWVWETNPRDLAPLFYDTLFNGKITGMFVGSGRIATSRLIRKKGYARVYAALCTHRGNFVVYSDDWGNTWAVLGSNEESCAPRGDEPKCEELPDGSVVLSSRKHGGLYVNIFRFSNKEKTEGAWEGVVDSRDMPQGISNEGTPCNGEILFVEAFNKKNKRTWLALQSIPAGPGRKDVTIYYKELASPADYASVRDFASNWRGQYRVSYQGSAYSTMVQQKDGKIAFFYEEEPSWYQMVYKALTISQITGGAYRATK